jgi:hypothetical protein
MDRREEELGRRRAWRRDVRLVPDPAWITSLGAAGLAGLFVGLVDECNASQVLPLIVPHQITSPLADAAIKAARTPETSPSQKKDDPSLKQPKSTVESVPPGSVLLGEDGGFLALRGLADGVEEVAVRTVDACFLG